MKNFIHFRHMRSFLMLWASQAVSTMGSAMTSFALLIWVYQQEGTATSIALLSFFSTAVGQPGSVHHGQCYD